MKAVRPPVTNRSLAKGANTMLNRTLKCFNRTYYCSNFEGKFPLPRCRGRHTNESYAPSRSASRPSNLKQYAKKTTTLIVLNLWIYFTFTLIHCYCFTCCFVLSLLTPSRLLSYHRYPLAYSTGRRRDPASTSSLSSS